MGNNNQDTPERRPAASEGVDYVRLQRAALRHVSELAQEVVFPIRSRIESDYQTGQKEAQERYEQEKRFVHLNYDPELQKAQKAYEDRVRAIRTQCHKAIQSAQLEAERKREEVGKQAVAQEEKAKQRHQEQEMVLEFVDGGAIEKVTQEHQARKTAYQASLGYIKELRQQADHLVTLYRRADLVGRVTHGPDTSETFEAQKARAEHYFESLAHLKVAKLFIGIQPVLYMLGYIGLVVVVMSLLHGLHVLPLGSLFSAVVAGLGLGLMTGGAGAVFLWRYARHEVQHIYEQCQEALAGAEVALKRHMEGAQTDLEKRLQEAHETQQTELRKNQQAFEATLSLIHKQRDTLHREIEEELHQKEQQLCSRRDQEIRDADRQYQDNRRILEKEAQEELAKNESRYKEELAECQRGYEAERSKLEEAWDTGLTCIRSLLEATGELDTAVRSDFDQWLDAAWKPTETSCSLIRFGTLQIDLGVLDEQIRRRAPSSILTDEPILLPALLSFPGHASLLVHFLREGRQQAVEALRAVMVRLFASLPPGRVRFTIMDPVGLGESFAGFMHAGDYLDSLVGGRIWTEPLQIQQQLEDLTQHMENVIQKYLRNEFDTIEQYNQQAGELAEPYRFLVIADFPTRFNDESIRRLVSVVQSGPRCGVYTLIACDERQALPEGLDLNDLIAGSIYLRYEHDRFIWQDDVWSRFALTLDRPPAESLLTRIMHVVGRGGREAARVEVPFDAVAPTAEQTWSRDSREQLSIPIGRTGATRLQYLHLGKGMEQHMLIAGKTGSGKSTLFHVIITSLAMWYSPDEVELYLVDFKKGVEFKTYVTNGLPHARAVAIESDREFGLSILHRLTEEMTRRGELFRRAGVQDIATYRHTTNASLARTVLMVDEFQMFFAEDDKIAQEAAIYLEQLVRQGRAFGIHVILGSQTLGGAFGLARSTIGQMAVRIALQCSEADSQLILSDDNTAARLLSRPGEAIYNNNGGQVMGNSPFQVAWLPDDCRDACLERLRTRETALTQSYEPMIVFEGNVPAEIQENRALVALLDHGRPDAETALTIWLGSPVAIKDPTSLTFQRQSGANLLIVGQHEEVALNLMCVAMVALSAQGQRDSLRFVVLDGSPADSSFSERFVQVTKHIIHTCRIVPYKEVPDIMGELAGEIKTREENERLQTPTVFVLIYGLQRYRMLRRTDDGFGFSLESDTQANPQTQFTEVLRDGPSLGIHVLIWADTLATLERSLERHVLREFDYRVLLQMSAGDSSNLIDSPAANQLGFHRALLYSEQQGTIEKFRPYAALQEDWLARVGRCLKQKNR